MSRNNVVDERRGSDDVGGRGRRLISPRARGRTRTRAQARPSVRPAGLLTPPPPAPPPRKSYVLVRGPGDPRQHHPGPVAPSPDRCGVGGDGAESESDPPPPPLSLRLPASFLSALPSGSRLELRGGGEGGGDPSTGSHPPSLVVVPTANLAQVDGGGDCDVDGYGADRGAELRISIEKEIPILRQHEAVARRSVVEVFRSRTPPPEESVGGAVPVDGGDVPPVPPTRLFLAGAVSARYEAVRAVGEQQQEEKADEGASSAPTTAAMPATPTTPAAPRAGGIDVAALGRRTRRRADEERRKRKEIVRLIDHDHEGGRGAADGEEGGDDDDGEPSTFISGVGTAPPKKRAKRRDAGDAAEKPPTKEKPTKPTRKRGRRQMSSTKQGRGKNSNYDCWMPTPPHGHPFPDGSNQTTPAIGSTTSDAVRVHGLPVGTGPEHVRKFFSGLDVSGVFVLAPCPGAFRLEGFDAEEPPAPPAPPPGTGTRRPRRRPPAVVVGPTIEREPERLRVIVRFGSDAAASLAVDRTGEGMVIPETSTTTETSGTSAAAAVLVTAIPRSTATFVLRNMAIEAVPGRPLSETARDVGGTGPMPPLLPPEAVDAVWAAALSSAESGLRPPPSAWAARADPPFGKGDDGNDAEKGGGCREIDNLMNRSVDVRRRVAACGSDDDDFMGRLVEYREALSDRGGDLEAWWAVSRIPHPPLTVTSSPSHVSCSRRGVGGAVKTEESVRRVVASGIRWLRREMEDVDVVLRQLREVTLLP